MMAVSPWFSPGRQQSGRFMLAETQSDSYERGADDGCNINLDYPWLLRFIMRHPALLTVAMWLGPDLSQPYEAPAPNAVPPLTAG
jgi:hypothetical protein